MYLASIKSRKYILYRSLFHRRDSLCILKAPITKKVICFVVCWNIWKPLFFTYISRYGWQIYAADNLNRWHFCRRLQDLYAGWFKVDITSFKEHFWKYINLSYLITETWSIMHSDEYELCMPFHVHCSQDVSVKTLRPRYLYWTKILLSNLKNIYQIKHIKN